MAEPRRAELKDQTDISGSHVVIIEARFYDDIQEALEDADIIMVVVPSSGHSDIARIVAPHIKDGQIIIQTPKKITIESTDADVHVKAATKITLEAPLVDEITDLVHNHGNQQIDGSCTHGPCSCP